MRLRKILIFILLIIAIQPGWAQYEAQFSQYYAMPTYYNAGAAGSTDYLRMLVATRQQWVGMTNAPTTYSLSADMPLKVFKQTIGIGIAGQQETLGLYSNMSFGAQLSYKRKLFKGQLSIGLQVGMVDTKFDGTKVVIPDDDDYHEGNDDAIPKQEIHGTGFDLGLGIFYTHKLFWVGLSATHLNQPNVELTAESSSESQTTYYNVAGRCYYFMGGSNIQLKNTLFEIMPSMMIKTDLNMFQAEATARVRWKKMVSGGVAYRLNDAVIAMLGVEYKNIMVGYAYDYPLSMISKASSGSHEVYIGYNLKLDFSDKNKNKHKSIRIM